METLLFADDLAVIEFGERLGRAYITGAILRQELEFRMMGGGLEFVGLVGGLVAGEIWEVVVFGTEVKLFFGAEVRIFLGTDGEASLVTAVKVGSLSEVQDVMVLESERDSIVSESEEFGGGEGEGGAERWRACLWARLEALPPLRLSGLRPPIAKVAVFLTVALKRAFFFGGVKVWVLWQCGGAAPRQL